jgi:hypothetical protein
MYVYGDAIDFSFMVRMAGVMTRTCVIVFLRLGRLQRRCEGPLSEEDLLWG